MQIPSKIQGRLLQCFLGCIGKTRFNGWYTGEEVDCINSKKYAVEMENFTTLEALHPFFRTVPFNGTEKCILFMISCERHSEHRSLFYRPSGKHRCGMGGIIPRSTARSIVYRSRVGVRANPWGIFLSVSSVMRKGWDENL